MTFIPLEGRNISNESIVFGRLGSSVTMQKEPPLLEGALVIINMIIGGIG
jgi:hypothetical protein